MWSTPKPSKSASRPKRKRSSSCTCTATWRTCPRSWKWRSGAVLVIEDAAQSIGADINGIKSGAGDMAIFSVPFAPELTTLGEGGMLVVKDPKLAALVPALRHNGHCGYPEPRPNY
ncbi:MAG: DegT/DnrJ/EryC1/StrS family aminotransferase [Bilophila wadsworthia]